MNFRERLAENAIVLPSSVLPSFMTPETKWGYDFVNSVDEKPEESFERIVDRIRKHYPAADEKTVRKILKR